MKYREYYSHLNEDYGIEKHITGLLKMGYTIDELRNLLKVDDNIIVRAIDDFAKEEMNKMKFNKLMEKIGYDYEREETETCFGQSYQTKL